MEEKIILTPKAKIWIESKGYVVFGGGRMKLFQAIEELGSIRQAASKLEMSYRAAWGKLKATEERLGIKLVEKHAGGQHNGAVLTPVAKKLLASYEKFKEDSVKKVDELFTSHFEWFINDELK